MVNLSKTQHPLLSLLLVTIQFSAIAYLALTANWFSLITSGLLLPLLIIGALIGLWALKTMHIDKVHVLPDPDENTVLVTTGPYRWIRHPMYLSVLTGCAALTLSHFSLMAYAVFGLLTLNLLVKLHYEEFLLLQRFEDYRTYQNSSHRLIPFVY